MTTLELKTKLDSFRHSTQLHQYKSVGDCHLYLSNGCKFFHELYDISWLLDIIFDFLHDTSWHPLDSTIWTVEKQHYGLLDIRGKTMLGKLLYEQYDIEQSFPLDEFTLFNGLYKAYLPMEVYYE